MDAPAPLIPEQRRRALLDLLRAETVLSTRTVADALGVSHMTVRRDIAQLVSERLVTAVPGGVRVGPPSGHEPPADRGARASLEIPSKRAIARLAAELVRDDMFVYLDAGTSCQAVVPHLAGHVGLTVVTSDLHIAVDLLDLPQIRTIHVGGIVDTSSGSTAGLFSTTAIRTITLDLCFMSTGSWNLKDGVTTPSMDKLESKRAALGSSARSVLLADSTKYGAASRYRVLPLDQFDGIITDEGIGDPGAEELRRAGVALSVAS